MMIRDMNPRSRIVQFASAAMVVMCQSACGPSTPIVKPVIVNTVYVSEAELATLSRTWMVDTSCSRPCWSGLMAGVSTFEDAQAVAASSPFTNRKGSYFPLPSVWFWNMGDRVVATMNHGIDARRVITDIEVRFLDKDISVGEVVSTLGEPEFVDAWIHTDRSGRRHELIYVYAAQGFALHVFALPNSVPDGTSAANLRELMFFAPGLNNYLGTRWALQHYLRKELPMPWVGFKGFFAYCQAVPSVYPCNGE